MDQSIKTLAFYGKIPTNTPSSFRLRYFKDSQEEKVVHMYVETYMKEFAIWAPAVSTITPFTELTPYPYWSGKKYEGVGICHRFRYFVEETQHFAVQCKDGFEFVKFDSDNECYILNTPQ